MGSQQEHSLKRGFESFASALLRIGNNWDNNDPFQGSIDDIRIYNRALSHTEVQTLYNEGGWATLPHITLLEPDTWCAKETKYHSARYFENEQW